jgi:predicted secreted Zn-dependent protease
MQTSQMHAHVLRAIELVNAGRRAEALHLLRFVVGQEPEFVAAWRWLAYCTPDPHEALAAIEHILQIEPYDAWAWQAREDWQTWQARRLAREYYTLPRAGPVVAPRRRPAGILPAWLSMVGMLLAVVALVGGMGLRMLSGFGVTGAFPARAVQTEPTALPPLELAPQVVTSTTVSYYTFQAGDMGAIQQHLYNDGPQLSNREHSIAMTTYELSVDWEMQQTPGACRVGSMAVNLDLEYIYPQWEPVGSPSRTLYEEWDRFMLHVVAHEEYHGRIALECANEIAELIGGIEPQRTCSALEGTLDVLISETYQTCEERQQAFDDVEGRTTFPLP